MRHARPFLGIDGLLALALVAVIESVACVGFPRRR